MALAIGLGIVAFFGFVIWSIKRHRDPVLRVDRAEQALVA